MAIVVIGAGNLGGALIEGWYGQHQIIVVDRNSGKCAQWPEVKHFLSLQEMSKAGLAENLEMVVLAVKPQHIVDVGREIVQFLPPEVPIVSVAAGVPLSVLSGISSSHIFVRSMPNTAARFRGSLTALCCSAEISFEVSPLSAIRQFFDDVGEAVILEQESDMHTFISLVGSGPAFWLEVVEAFCRGGQRLSSIEDERALNWVRASMQAALSALEGGVTPKDEQARIASKGGTTEAGLKDLQAGALHKAIYSGLRACSERSKEMEKSIT